MPKEPSDFEVAAREIHLRALRAAEANQQRAADEQAAHDVLGGIEALSEAESVQKQNEVIARWSKLIRETAVFTAELLRELQVPSEPASWSRGPLTRLWKITDSAETRSRQVAAAGDGALPDVDLTDVITGRFETGYALTEKGEIVIFRQRNSYDRGDNPWPVINRVVDDEQLVPRWKLDDTGQLRTEQVDLWSERLLHLFDTAETEASYE